MRKRTLNQTWVLCLRMWRWISKEWKKEEREVGNLKILWLKENKISMGGALCFFCDYTDTINLSCSSCPGRLVDSSFSCFRQKYNFEDNPVAFYKELLRLNRIRKAKK